MIESTLGKGTRFDVYPTGVPAGPKGNADRGQGIGIMARILVIDDEETVRGLIRQILAQAGHEVEEAENGAAGLAAMRLQAAELVITDIIMPEMEGVETVLALRKEFPDTPVIAMSGGGRTANFDFLATAKKLGAARVLQKPFRPATLLEAVAACLR
ncbi:hypothetical protein FRZ61_11020 [Hypericibacter adhaerens]|uniref:Response regulatory domain-containing protein n=2 Tax=Hypericibacter adhaerens TaxID=2602016 RepID=A0A5J6MY41_9PROT|nr:hypothetical protein FRZ61_11020 [Hypericibacter adhaerens]